MSRVLDMIDTTAPIESASPVSFNNLLSKYDALLLSYSVRTNNVLQALADKYSDKHTFLEEFVKMSRKEIATLKNCGVKTIEEILDIQNILDPNHEGQHSDAVEIVQKTLPDNIDTLLPLIMPRLEGMSVRAKNGFAIFLEENHNSLAELYAAVTNPKFNPVKMKNVGRTSVVEIKTLLDRIRDFLECFPDEHSVETAVTKFYTRTLDDVRIPFHAQERIHELESTLGHFPLFAAINAFFEGLKGVNRTIFDALFNIHEGQTLRNMDEVAAELGLSRERVRQKRNKLLNTISEYFTTYRTLRFVDKCQYNYQMRRIHEDINAQEGTNFNLNFVNWVLASVFEDVSLLGDELKTITGYYEKGYFLCLVPTELCQYMDFSAFLEDVDAHLAKKHINEEKVNLQSLINTHLKTQYCEEEMPAIETACRSILYLHYPVEVDFGQVIFKPNARKNNPIVIEEIIRAAGHPLTLEEIYEEFIFQYPERYTEMRSLRGGINSNHNIVPIGRSSTYTLAEWEGETLKGGTIRQIVSDYLDNLENPIALASEIGEYVRRFRPETSDSSISSNLLQERHHKFIVLVKDGRRYIGYSDREYDSEYRIIAGDRPTKRSTQKSMQLLEKFIQEHSRYPYGTDVDDEEARLYRFVGNRRSASTRNAIPEKEIEEWQQFEEKYREYDVPRFRKRRSRKAIGEETNV